MTEEPPESFTKSLFLVGPSPRKAEDGNWRPAAIDQLEQAGYDGVVFIPLPRDGDWSHGFDNQVGWETMALNHADVIAAWVPRDMTVTRDVKMGESAEKAMKLPALTTNVEFGLHVHSGKLMMGFPQGTPKMRYLDWHAQVGLNDL